MYFGHRTTCVILSCYKMIVFLSFKNHGKFGFSLLLAMCAMLQSDHILKDFSHSLWTLLLIFERNIIMTISMLFVQMLDKHSH